MNLSDIITIIIDPLQVVITNFDFIGENSNCFFLILELINQKTPTFKTLLMCNKYSEIEEVVTFLNTKGIEASSFEKRVTGTEIKRKYT